MVITKEHNRPEPYFVQVGERCFWFTFEPLKNNINGHPRRSVKVIYKTEPSGRYWARSFVIVLYYESESDAALELAYKIVNDIERK